MRYRFFAFLCAFCGAAWIASVYRTVLVAVRLPSQQVFGLGFERHTFILTHEEGWTRHILTLLVAPPYSAYDSNFLGFTVRPAAIGIPFWFLTVTSLSIAW